MGHAPLSSLTPYGLDFNAHSGCSQNQQHFKQLTCTADRRDMDLRLNVQLRAKATCYNGAFGIAQTL